MTSKKREVRNNRGTKNISSTSLKGRYGGSRSVEAYKKGPWTKEEDALLIEYVKQNGDKHWNCVQKTGLLRCGKSCRLRWMNHLRPDLKKGSFSYDEEIVVIELHRKLGNKWSKIANKLPGRTDNEVKNFWNTKIKRRMKNNTPNIGEDNIPQSQRGNVNIVAYQNSSPNNNAIPINAPMNFNTTLEPTTEIHSMTSLVMHHDPIMSSFNGSSYNFNLFLEEREYQNTFLPQSFPNGSHMSFNNLIMTPSMKGTENALRVEHDNEKTINNYDHDEFFTFDTYNQTSGTVNATNDIETRSNMLREETEFMDEELSSLLLNFSSY